MDPERVKPNAGEHRRIINVASPDIKNKKQRDNFVYTDVYTKVRLMFVRQPENSTDKVVSKFNRQRATRFLDSPIAKRKFLHYCCDEILEGKSVDWKNYNDDIEWTTEDINKSKAIVKELICKWIMYHDELEKPEFISETVFNVMQNCLETRRESIEYHLIKNRFLEAEHNLLENIDWKIKWVLGNSMLPSYKEPILQLKLGCCRKSSIDLKFKHNTVDFEMNIEQVNHLIEVLETASREFTTND